ncbi:MAG: acetyl-CoA carboxylase carboxyltransferase subunit beta [Chlamydiae bacterium]|nr:acetyl-CoA carboxylase carboxyltransferase subunit beta [Chlamydiota bacterium]
MGLFSRNKPKIKVEAVKKDGFSGWIKCSGCSEMIHANELQNNINCCPKCGYHYRMSAKQRIALLSDENSFQEMFSNFTTVDVLNFVDSQKYVDRIKEAREKSGGEEAALVGTCRIQERTVALGVLDFSFMGGSMGSVVGEKITLIIEYATKNNLPVVIVSASGGARMQESILSLMQMAKTSAALTKLHEKRLPYISVLTNPTTGGVTASFASLGDIIIAEPDALIAFAGPRVVEQTIGQKLPKGAQKSEFLLEKGMIDGIVERKDLKKKISYFIEFFMDNPRPEDVKDRLQQKLKQLLKFADMQETEFAQENK